MKSLSVRRTHAAEDNFRSDLLTRLDVVIALLLERSESDSKVSTSDKIAKLIELGVSPADVARILGKTTNYVTAALAVRRRRKT
jgi:hypothetical protein